MMEESLGRWLREEMELPPSAAPSPAALRRLCSGPTAPIWDYVIRHVRNQRNVKKIRGNLRWYGHLQELQACPVPPGRQGALRAAVERLRKELRGLGDAIEDAQETAQRLEASLEEEQNRRWAELQRGAELRLLGAEPSPAGLRDGHEGALRALHKRPGPSRAELSAILASGAEPEVLVSIKALCKAREAELRRPRPRRAANHHGKAQEAPDWLEQAEAVLIGHSPGAVLWALEALANQSTRALLAGPAPSVEAPPTLRSLLQERWGAVGGVWGALPPLLSHLAQLRGHLRSHLRGHLRSHPRGHLGTHLERGRGSDGTTRLFLLREGLSAFRGCLGRALTQLQNPQNSPQKHQKTPKPQKSQNPDPKTQKSQNSAPKSPNLDPKSALKSQNSASKSPNFDPKSSNFDTKFSDLAPNSASNLDPKSPNSTPNLALKSPNLAPNSASNLDPKSSNLDPKSSDLAPNLAPSSSNLDPKSSNLNPNSASDLASKSPNLDPKSSNLAPKSSNLNPNSSPNLAPNSSNLAPKSSNLDPKFSDLVPNSASNLAPKSPNLNPNSAPNSSNFDPKSSNLAPNSAPNLAPKSPNLDPKSSNLAPNSAPNSASNLAPKSPNLAPKSPDLDTKSSNSAPNFDPKSSNLAPNSASNLAPKSPNLAPNLAPKSSNSAPNSDPKSAPNLDPKFSDLDPKFSDLVTKSAPNLDPKSSNLASNSAPNLDPKSSNSAPNLAQNSSDFDPKSSNLATNLAPKSSNSAPNLDPKFPDLTPNLAPNFCPKFPNFDPNFCPKSPNFAPNCPSSALERLRQRLRRGRGRVVRLQQRLRFLSAASRGRRAALGARREQVVGVARAGPGSAPPPLEGAWLRRRQLAVGGALGAEPRPLEQATPPLQGLAREMGVAQGSLLSRAAILRQRLRQGAVLLRRGAGPALGACPEPPAPPPLPEGVAELLPRLRLVSEGCQQRIRDWPRLQELVSQWWAQPAQWALATPSGHAPFSHWLQRWRAAAHALQATPTPDEAPPTAGKGEEPGEEEAPPI